MYGDTPAGRILAEMVQVLVEQDPDEGRKIRRKVSNLYQEYTTDLLRIEEWVEKDLDLACRVGFLLCEDAKRRVKIRQLPTKISTFLENVIDTEWKRFLHWTQHVQGERRSALVLRQRMLRNQRKVNQQGAGAASKADGV